MLSDELKKQVAAATVKVIEDGKAIGSGFIVHGGFILTAAHCVNWDGYGGLALGDYFPVKCMTVDGKELTGQVVAVDPVVDVAVIGEPDSDMATEGECLGFLNHSPAIPPLTVAGYEPGLFNRFPVFVLRWDGQWLDMNAQVCQMEAPRLWIEANDPIIGGTSGSPIVDERGHVVAVVSNSSGGDDSPGYHPTTGLHARPHLALPVWVWRSVAGSQEAST